MEQSIGKRNNGCTDREAVCGARRVARKGVVSLIQSGTVDTIVP